MKIAILTPTFSQFSGIDRVMEGKAEGWAKKGNDVTIFAFKSDIKPKGYKVEILGAPSNPAFERLYRLFFFIDFTKINKYVNKLKGYDVIYSTMYPMNIIASKAKEKYGIKYIYYNAGVAYPWLFGNILERAYMQLFSYFTRLSVKNADSAISISDFLRKELIRESGINGTVEYVKIDAKRFNKNVLKQGKKIYEVRKKYGLKFPTLLYVGRISPHKGIHLLIKAFGILKKKYSDARLLIVGKHTFDSYSKKLSAMGTAGVIFAFAS